MGLFNFKYTAKTSVDRGDTVSQNLKQVKEGKTGPKPTRGTLFQNHELNGGEGTSQRRRES
uniref:Uncharacterized protein n=1 Tax=Aegilops tauschii subsp. strangulata TaxID=200361 RepID=A0A453G727_AEGTS